MAQLSNAETKLIFIDLNGSTLQHGRETPTESVSRISREVQEEGHFVVPVTSNSPVTLGAVPALMGFSSLGVLHGGATIYDFAKGRANKALSHELPTQTVRDVVGGIRQYITQICYTAESKMRTPTTIDLDEITAPSPSIFMEHPLANILPIGRALANIEGINVIPNESELGTNLGCLQIVTSGVSKASGILAVLDSEPFCDIPAENIACLCDGKNDKDMVEAMPPGSSKFIVANAVDELKLMPGVTVVPSVGGGPSEIDPLGREAFVYVGDRFMLGRQ
jgi:hydroxymethylpyrimidine pyrophosphatase-like HAD family hydrolase